MESERIRLAGLLAGWLGRPIHSGSLASSLPTSIMYRDLLYGRERGGKGGGGGAQRERAARLQQAPDL